MAQLWKRFLTQEEIDAVKARANTDLFFMLDVAVMERKLEEDAYGRCGKCGRVNSFNGVCYSCLGKDKEAQG